MRPWSDIYQIKQKTLLKQLANSLGSHFLMKNSSPRFVAGFCLQNTLMNTFLDSLSIISRSEPNATARGITLRLASEVLFSQPLEKNGLSESMAILSLAALQSGKSLKKRAKLMRSSSRIKTFYQPLDTRSSDNTRAKNYCQCIAHLS